MKFIYAYAAIGFLLVTLAVPACELTNFCPLVDYKTDCWSPFKGICFKV